MASINIQLTDAERERLRAIAHRTGKAEEELVREALALLDAQTAGQDRRSALRQAKGIWRDRDDLPDLSELRAEMNRGLSAEPAVNGAPMTAARKGR